MEYGNIPIPTVGLPCLTCQQIRVKLTGGVDFLIAGFRGLVIAHETAGEWGSMQLMVRHSVTIPIRVVDHVVCNGTL